MKKIMITFVSIDLVIILAIIAFLVHQWQTDNKIPDVKERIERAPAVKLEYAGTEDPAVFDTSHGVCMIRDGLAGLYIVPADGTMEEDWIYRFTFYPDEICPGDDARSAEIEVLFGETSMSIDEVRYIPEDGTLYSGILEWARAAYDYFS